MLRVGFASERLDPHLDDDAREEASRAILSGFYTHTTFERLGGRPFSAGFEAAAVGGLHVGRFRGTVACMSRGAAQVAAGANDDFMIGINEADAPLGHSQRRREVALRRGEAVFCTNALPGAIRSDEDSAWLFMSIPRAALEPLVPGIEDLVGNAFDPKNPGVAHLRGYLRLLLESDLPADPGLDRHIAGTLIDLVTLAVGAERPDPHGLRRGGIAAGHLRAALAHIQAHFARPGYGLDDLCRALRLSPRHVQFLFARTGRPLTAHLLGLRLARARHLLTRPGSEQVRIIDIAYASGFEDVAYFNRRFRACYGHTPSECRRAAGRP